MKSSPARRDGDRRLVFPPLPTARLGRSFADTWWGNAWVQALEGPSRSATGRLARGRTYARAGNVAEIVISPGVASARVQGSRPTPYRTTMAVPQLTPMAWDALLDVVAGRAGHIAALLEHDMPPALADDAARAGARLLPTPHELTPTCSCPDWGNPCKHAAALYYQVARLLDHDPFVLLLLRGRGRSELMTELHHRNAGPSPATSGYPPPAGVPARDVFAAARAGLPPLPAPTGPVDQVGRVPGLRHAADPAPGLDPAALEFLAADTATRAARLLRQALRPDGESAPPVTSVNLPVTDDLIRLAAADEVFTRLVFGAHRTPLSLTRAARAWQYGGPAALAVLDDSWPTDPNRLNPVRESLRAASDGEDTPRISVTDNWIGFPDHDAQLRLGTCGRLWYPYRRESGTWWPAGPPHHDPVTVRDALLGRPTTTHARQEGESRR
ncbi:SWIM zinc finger family protein [Streptomyces sp. BE20]|uniref:SWIM zinc finger family protein n=1 Tax=Streptomyces sp. BE20 TaxID=3002525 RepID=UPI002E7739DF|nr:SWIM zinc finger family protein [Streptomyces sp. BE20]MEE1820886.1 SWIM zinc finger family protein [Streptomyces sp. BE20]